ncbi:MAG: hypothetical protein KIS72_02565 [Luteimonas sp.]|uniref:hypothetical protein n=1 Tax=Dokdonella sp. TaxID=2291710 RepID=UPI0025BE371F|nr:hypothetical protein [Dokdonella sp.]MBX3702034.1 hypothetical protein [Dokdonella sp.]MCW5580208.1 hypothetical protein [Luteimonas sp.]
MTTPHWPRGRWQDSGGEAFWLWFVFGDFAADLRIDAQRYRTGPPPTGVEAVRYRNAALAQWDGYPLAGTLGAIFEEENPRLLDAARKSTECWMLRGSLRDPADLDGLRNMIGTISALCDQGAVAVVDPQMLSLFAADEWQRRYFARDAFHARDHVLILADTDPADASRMRVHTRGLRKFARADLDIRNVPPALTQHAGELAQGFVEFQCDGGVVADGHAVALGDDGQQLVATLIDDAGDADFNNRHLRLRWPERD